MNNKSILIIIPRLSSGGAERQAVTIAQMLDSKGYNVGLLTYFKGDFYKELLEKCGIAIHTSECNGMRRIFKVTQYIRKGGYDVVISLMQTPNFLNNFSKLFGNRRKVITSIRATPRVEDLKTFQGRIYGLFYKNSDVIVSNSFLTKKIFGKYYPQYNDKLITIYNAVQLGPVTTNYIIRKNNCLNIIVAATVSKIKNPHGLLNALLLMDETDRALIHIDWYGKKESVIGDHAEYDSVIDTILSNNLHNCISIHDATKNISSLMNESDCVALFSQMEGLPNVICEGMTLGKPIIMTRCSDYAILVEDGLNGFLCDWDDPESIKMALLKMASASEKSLIRMGAESKKKASIYFSEEIIAEQWRQIIDA